MKKQIILTSLLLAGLSVTSAYADTQDANLVVGVTVPSDCIVSTSQLQFAEFSPASGDAEEGQAAVSITCNAGTNFSVGLDSGLNFDTTRRMSNGASYLQYGLYQDSAYSSPWTDINTLSGTGTGSVQTLDVYGRIFAGQINATTGAYTDTVVATVTY